MAPSQRDQDLQDALLFAGVVYMLAVAVGGALYLIRAAMWLVAP